METLIPSFGRSGNFFMAPERFFSALHVYSLLLLQNKHLSTHRTPDIPFAQRAHPYESNSPIRGYFQKRDLLSDQDLFQFFSLKSFPNLMRKSIQGDHSSIIILTISSLIYPFFSALATATTMSFINFLLLQDIPLETLKTGLEKEVGLFLALNPPAILSEKEQRDLYGFFRGTSLDLIL